MQSNPTVVLDFHGVTADALDAKHALMCEHTQLAIPRADFNGRGVIGKTFPHRDRSEKPRAVTDGHYEHVKMRLYEDPDGFFKYLKPMPGAKKAFRQLINGGCYLIIVSNLRIQHRGKVIAWLKREGILYHEVELTDGRPKTEFYELGDLVIDDELRHLEPVAGRVRSATLMLPCEAAAGHRAIQAPSSLPKGVRAARGWGETLVHCKTLLAAA